MKELSIEQKAKRYDELKVTAQELEHDGCFDKITLFDLFPELKEGEDEKIRKELLDFCKNRAEYYPNNPKYKNISAWIAWLEKQSEKESVTCPICGWEIEKQGEQQPAWSEEDERILVEMQKIFNIEKFEGYNIGEDNEDALRFLKSLKDRYTWKPSDEQMEALQTVYDWYKNNLPQLTGMQSLFNDLSKLKE